MPQRFVDYGATWLKHHPAWDMKLWTEDNIFPLKNQDQFDLAESMSSKSDVARYEILEACGGVYIDTDFECLRSIEPLLSGVEIFSAAEADGIVSCGIIGSVPHHLLLQDLVETLPKQFTVDAPPNESTGPVLMTQVAKRHPEVKIYHADLFYPVRYKSAGPHSLVGAYAVHHWAGSWTKGI